MKYETILRQVAMYYKYEFNMGISCQFPWQYGSGTTSHLINGANVGENSTQVTNVSIFIIVLIPLTTILQLL